MARSMERLNEWLLLLCICASYLLCAWGDDAPLFTRRNDLKMMCLCLLRDLVIMLS